MKYFTTTLTSGSLTINAADGAGAVSIQAADSSSCTVLGGISFKGVSSAVITLENGRGVTIPSASPSSPIDGITITWISGNIDIIISFGF